VCYSTAERNRKEASILSYSILHQLIITGVFHGIKTSALMFIPQLKETEKHLFYSILFYSILFYSTSSNYHWCFSGNQNKCVNVYSTAERNRKEASILFYSVLFYSILHWQIITGVFQGIKSSALVFIPQLNESIFYSVLFYKTSLCDIKIHTLSCKISKK